MTDTSGAPVAGRTVAVYAEVHEPGEDGTGIIRLEPLGSITTDRRGRLVGDASLGRQAVQREPDRPALRLFSSGPEGVLVRHVELDEHGVAVPDGPVDDVADGAVPSPVGTTAGDGDMLRLTTGPLGEGADLSVTGHSGAPCDFPYYVSTSSFLYRWVPGTTGGFASTLPYNTQRRIEAYWRYRRYNLWCRSWLGGPGTYHGSWEWRPDRREGNRNINGAGSVTCGSGTRRQHDNEEWISRNSTYTTSGFYSINSVSLRSQQSSSTSHELRIFPKLNPTFFCGSNTVPLYAQMVRETT